jgi:hypothetical protein
MESRFMTRNVDWGSKNGCLAVNSQRLRNNPSRPIDTEQYMHDKIGCMGCKYCVITFGV